MSTSRYLTGLAVPHGQPTPVFDPNVGAMMEMFQPGSAVVGDLETQMVPLLSHHDTARPIGRVCRAWEQPDGMHVEARLVAGDDQLAAPERQVDAGITSGLSIGFLPDRGADQWTTHRPTGLPMALRRQAQLVEPSVVVWPAFASARVSAIRDQSTLHDADTEVRAWLLGEQLQLRPRQHLRVVAWRHEGQDSPCVPV